MNEVLVLSGAEPREILRAVIEKKMPAIMSYSSKGKWHVAKVLLTSLGATRLSIEVWPRAKNASAAQANAEAQKPHPINIKTDQPVGMSIKYGYGKFIFDTKVMALEPSPSPTSGGTIILEVPEMVELVQRRSYFRVKVPKSLNVEVLLWLRSQSIRSSSFKKTQNANPDNRQTQAEHYWHGKLMDISAGGVQVVIEATQRRDLKKGQFVGLRLTPLPYEIPLMFNAQIRDLLPTADGKDISLGMQIVGLEASPEGRSMLSRLVEIVERYYQINQSSAKQQDMRGLHFAKTPFYSKTRNGNSPY